MSFDNFKIKKMSFSDNKKFKKKKPPFMIDPEIAVGSKYSQKKMLLYVFLKVSLNTGTKGATVLIVEDNEEVREYLLQIIGTYLLLQSSYLYNYVF